MKKEFEQALNEVEQDPRNAEYTQRGIKPIVQLSKQAKILIISQAPGKKVEETGIPFNDLSGKKLREWMGLDEQAFYSDKIAIMPMDFYYPGKAKSGDLPPRAFMKQYHEALLEQMPNIELIVLVGKYAIDAYLKEEAYPTLTETVKNYAFYLPKYFPIVHPSPLNQGWRKKNPWFEENVVPVLREKIQACLGDTKKENAS